MFPLTPFFAVVAICSSSASQNEQTGILFVQCTAQTISGTRCFAIHPCFGSCSCVDWSLHTPGRTVERLHISSSHSSRSEKNKEVCISPTSIIVQSLDTSAAQTIDSGTEKSSIL